MINRDVGHPGVLTPDRFELLPGAAAAIAWLKARGFAVAVVTNQKCIAQGHATRATVDAIHDKLARHGNFDIYESL